MIQRDYLLRMIEQMVRVLHLLTGLVDARKYPEALAMLNQAYKDIFGLDSDTLNSLPLEYLIRHLDGNAERGLVLAALFDAEADTLHFQGHEAAAVIRWQRAVHLLLALEAAQPLPTLPGLAIGIPHLTQRLSSYSLPNALTIALFRYHAGYNHGATAENLLWEWLESGTERATAAAEGIEFYEQMMAWHSTELEAQGLTLVEMEESYRAFMTAIEQGL